MKPRLTFLELQERLNLLIDNPRTKFNVTTHKSAGSAETFFEFLEYFVKDCETGVRLSPKRQLIKPKSLGTYKTNKSYIKKFEQQASRQLFLTDFEQKDIDQISDFLIINYELAMNTHAKIMMDLLQIIKYAVHLKKIAVITINRTKIWYVALGDW